MKCLKIGRVLWFQWGRRGYGKLPGWEFGFVLFPRESGDTIAGALRFDGALR